MKSLTAFLIYVSLLLSSSCGVLRQSHFKPIGLPNDSTIINLVPFPTSSVYKTDILLGNKSLSGIIVFKKTAPASWRIVFLNELGMKFFDFQLTKNEFRVIECYEYLNRKKLLTILEQDFRLLLDSSADLQLVKNSKLKNETIIIKEQLPQSGRNKYYYLSKNTYLPKKTELIGFWRQKTTILYKTYTKNRPDTFAICHNDLKLELRFKILNE